MTSERSRQVASVFDLVADTYDRTEVPWFTPIARRLVAELAPAPGERAVDIGCGRGAALWALADAVGPDGRVVGFDLAERMVAATRADVAASGVTHVEVTVGDAAEPALPAESFDVVAASLVLFFLPEPGDALSRWRDLLVTGGRLGISSFGPRSPEWVALDDLFTPYLPEQMLDARTSGARGPFASDDGVEELFVTAGLTGVRTVTFDLSTTFRDIAQWHQWSMSHGQRAMWQNVPEAERPGLVGRAAEVLAPASDGGHGFVLTQGIRLTLGRR